MARKSPSPTRAWAGRRPSPVVTLATSSSGGATAPPSYQLACAADDADFGITEVVRGEDLVRSTFRQLLLFRALGAPPPAYFHASLLRDERGTRLAKRHDALSLRALRAAGRTPSELIAGFAVDPT